MLPGAPVSDAVFEGLKPRIDALVAAGHPPGLGTILVGDDGASAGYVRVKHAKCAELGLESFHEELPADATQADLFAAVRRFNDNPAVDAMLIQHPIPGHLDYEAALEHMDPDKDADGLHPVNLGRLALSIPAPVPATPAGIEALLAHYEIPVAGRHVVILGRGFTLGRPLSMLLSQKRPTPNT
jgi:methylenetetrahydrofolate dehydrogenase (NADP+) / methenyltetrahydrofolate cyclohydrolase